MIFDLSAGLNYFPVCRDRGFYEQLIAERLPVERRDKALSQGAFADGELSKWQARRRAGCEDLSDISQYHVRKAYVADLGIARLLPIDQGN